MRKEKQQVSDICRYTVICPGYKMPGYFSEYFSIHESSEKQTYGFVCVYASVKGNLELPLLKGRRRFDVETTSNLEVYILRGWWILT